MKSYNDHNCAGLSQMCNIIKKQLKNSLFTEAESEIRKLMGMYPESGIPHNLYGILLEYKGEHSKAMNHFRAAIALDSSCKACRYNLEAFGSSSAHIRPAYTDSDLGFFHQAAEKFTFRKRSA